MGELKLDIKLMQQLVMTPQLQQAIKLLQMSRLELQHSINAELMENPVLEEGAESIETSPAESKDVEKEVGSDDFDWQKYLESYDTDSTAPPSTKIQRAPDEHLNIENVATKTETLYEHLVWQLKMTGFTKKEETFGEKIIENLSDDGYLIASFDDLVKDSKLSPEEAEEVLLRIQEFDPVGIAARDIKECLLQQVRQLNIKEGKLIALIKNYLPDLENQNYPSLAKKLNVSIERVFELARVVLSLEPKPGRAFTQTEAQYIVPDVYVFKVGDEYVISLNDEGLPRLRISSYYKEIISDTSGKVKEETRNYIQERLRAAIALIKSVQHRQKTIYRVTEAIVKRQIDFLEHGILKLKPMVLKEIADDITMHESTISRITTNKYVHTPQGLFELKFFFNNPISSLGGAEDVASESARVKIGELIAGEDPRSPLSDQQIANALKKFNIDIARRTVAKYREVLGFLPSGKRKKYVL